MCTYRSVGTYRGPQNVLKHCTPRILTEARVWNFGDDIHIDEAFVEVVSVFPWVVP